MEGLHTGEQELIRKEAAKFINTTPATMRVWDSRKKHNLQPIKKPNGRVYYRVSVLKAHRDRHFMPE